MTDRVRVRLKNGCGHPFAGREGTIDQKEWDGNAPHEAGQVFMVRMTNHPATVKAARWQIEEWMVGGWVDHEMTAPPAVVLPELGQELPESPDALLEQEVDALVGRPTIQGILDKMARGVSAPAAAAEERAAPPLTAHRTPAEKARELVWFGEGKVSVRHEGVEVTFAGSPPMACALMAILEQVIAQSRTDGAALASPDGGQLAPMLAELAARVDALEGEIPQIEELAQQAADGVAVVSGQIRAARNEEKGRLSAVEGRCAELEIKMRTLRLDKPT